MARIRNDNNNDNDNSNECMCIYIYIYIYIYVIRLLYHILCTIYYILYDNKAISINKYNNDDNDNDIWHCRVSNGISHAMCV